MFHRNARLLAIILLLVMPRLAAGQTPAADAAPPLITLGSITEDSIRLAQLRGEATTSGFLLRTASSLGEHGGFQPAHGVRWQLVRPELRAGWNSDLPRSLNNGAMWSGRGLSMAVMGGVRATMGRVEVTVAPTLAYSQNLQFQFIPYPFADRSPFSSPWHLPPAAIDLPLRFGSDAFTAISPGGSSLRIHAAPVVFGLSSEQQWWGPGIRNALVMSDNAPGIPRLFVRTANPLHTAIGDFAAEWMLGQLTESAYFDTISNNDHRSLSAAAITFRPTGEPGLTLGATRAVFAPVRHTSDLFYHAFQVLGHVGRPNDRALNDYASNNGPDQIFSLFGRWVFPASGFETYLEWARTDAPSSFRDLLVAPEHSQGYTLGAQWSHPVATARFLRVQTEITNLEENATLRFRHVHSFYTSRPVPQGYTNRGRVIGASIGPGSDSQWLALDLIGSAWRFGLFGGRIRWENDALYSSQVSYVPSDHDVSVFGGLRGAARLLHLQAQAELTYTRRINYLFQNPSANLAFPNGLEIRNLSLQLRLRPVSRPRP